MLLSYSMVVQIPPKSVAGLFVSKFLIIKNNLSIFIHSLMRKGRRPSIHQKVPLLGIETAGKGGMNGEMVWTFSRVVSRCNNRVDGDDDLAGFGRR